MKLNNPWMSAVLLLFCFQTVAFAKVRETLVSENAMEPVALKIGQSTILRFKEKPKKVVIGNQNYFNVEFIDNDITIQPLGIVSTNFFVYGDYHTYGFILNVGGTGTFGNYDDLVMVKWKPNISIKPKLAPISLPSLSKEKTPLRKE